jgi:hypothetical protein
MILPHYYAKYIKGDIVLNDEYEDYRWIKVNELNKFEPKIKTIPDIVKKIITLKNSL